MYLKEATSILHTFKLITFFFIQVRLLPNIFFLFRFTLYPVDNFPSYQCQKVIIIHSPELEINLQPLSLQSITNLTCFQSFIYSFTTNTKLFWYIVILARAVINDKKFYNLKKPM